MNLKKTIRQNNAVDGTRTVRYEGGEMPVGELRKELDEVITKDLEITGLEFAHVSFHAKKILPECVFVGFKDKLKHLRSLRIIGCGLSGVEMNKLAEGIDNTCHLTELVLEGNLLRSSDWIVPLITKSNIKTLSIQNCYFNDHLQLAADLAMTENRLEKLFLSVRSLDSVFFAAFGKTLKAFTSLRCLHLGSESIYAWQIGRDFVEAVRGSRLEEVGLGGSCFFEQLTKAMCQRPDDFAIKRLYTAHCVAVDNVVNFLNKYDKIKSIVNIHVCGGCYSGKMDHLVDAIQCHPSLEQYLVNCRANTYFRKTQRKGVQCLLMVLRARKFGNSPLSLLPMELLRYRLALFLY